MKFCITSLMMAREFLRLAIYDGLQCGPLKLGQYGVTQTCDGVSVGVNFEEDASSGDYVLSVAFGDQEEIATVPRNDLLRDIDYFSKTHLATAVMRMKMSSPSECLMVGSFI